MCVCACVSNISTSHEPPLPQVYSLGFHQATLELTRHALDKSLLHLALWRGFAFLWDAALQVREARGAGAGRWVLPPCGLLGGRWVLPPRGLLGGRWVLPPRGLLGGRRLLRRATIGPAAPHHLASPSHFDPFPCPPTTKQVVFPAETVQQGRERQAALLAGEQLLGQLGAERARSAALELVRGSGRG